MSSGIQRATGRDRDEWFGVLDDWGAPGRPYREIVSWLTDKHGMSSWWGVVAQFDDQTVGKCTVSVQHQRISDAQAAEAAKAYWRERLAALKTMLEER